jgi:uncharacterized protein YqgC (DUF456 family)
MLNSLVFPNFLLLSLTLASFPFVFGARTSDAFYLVNIMLLVAVLFILFTYWTAHRQGSLHSSARGAGTILGRACLFMLMSSGLAVHNGLAVVQGLLGQKTAFMRTPKLNIVTRQDNNFRKTAYLSGSSRWIVGTEIILAFLFTALAGYCLMNHIYSVIPSYAFFASGYIMIVYFTIAEIRANLKTSNDMKTLTSLEHDKAPVAGASSDRLS